MLSIKKKLRINLIFITFCLLTSPASAGAQQTFHVRVDYLDNSQFPLIESYVSVSDQNGLPIKNLMSHDFSVIESRTPIAIEHFAQIQNIKQPLTIALVMDVSASMGSKNTPTPMQKSIDAAKFFVGQLQPQDKISVIKFSDKPELLLSMTEDKKQVNLSLDSLKPEGSQTALYDGLIEAINTLKSQSGRRIIVLVTDGKDTNTGIFNFEVAIREAGAASIPIYPMGFGSTINAKEMKQMAELTGGTAQILPHALDLQKSFTEILSILREQYLISYVSTLPADNKDHEILVTASYGGAQEQATYHFLSKSSVIEFSLPDFQSDQVVGGLVKFTPVTKWQAPLKSMEVLMDGQQIAKVESIPFEYTWNSFAANATSGSHNFLLRLEDIAGNVGQSKISLNVQPPIVVEILEPAADTPVSGIVNIVAKVTSLPGVALNKIAFVVDDKEIASTPANSNLTEYQTDWDTNDYPPETHSIRVVAYDTEGIFVTEDKAQINVKVSGISGVIILVVFLGSLLVIPFAMRSRRRAKQAGEITANLTDRKPVLRELEGINPDKTWPLGSTEIKLGRKREKNDIPLKGLNASRHHASIRFEQGKYVIYNLSTSKNILVNNLPVRQMQALKAGDTIQLGETILRFEG